jgi:CRP-like cAMP-binding protein
LASYFFSWVGALKLHLEAFAEFSPRDRSLIDRLVERNVRELGPRRDLVREGERPRAVCLLLDGWACRYKQFADGRRQIVGFHIPGDLCDPNLAIVSAMDHSIAAVTRLRYAEIGLAEFEAMVEHSPALARALRWSELVNAAVAREWVANVGQRSAYERIAHLFCEMFLRLRSAGLADGDSCAFPLTQTDLASATGLTAVHVNRTLQEMRRDGLLEFSFRRLVVPDLEALKRIGTFNATYLHLGRNGVHLD